MTSFSVDETLNQSCSSPVLGKRKPIKPPSSVNSSRFKIISQVARDIYSIPISTVPSESAFSTGGRVLDSFRSSLTPQIAESLICAQNWIQSKPLDDMTEEIDGADEIDEEFINIGKEMEATFENLNNDSMV
uniref:HAT C-terminal dimerisation domain-containing protein n=1 Tax=Cucumis melo TaxID=3656 RepID=A0A9I9EBD2_CUCME